LPAGERVAVAVIDDGTVADGSGWLANYKVAQNGQVAPSDHTTQVVSVILGASQPDAIDPDTVEILVLPVNLAAEYQGSELATQLDQALQDGADVVVVTVGARHDQAGICASADALAAGGAILIAAAGNFPSLGADFPARCDGAASIAALDAPGVFSSYSTRRQVDFGMVAKGVEAIDLDGAVSEPGGTSIAAAAAARVIIHELVRGGNPTEERLPSLFEPIPDQTNKGKD
jgi:subtilisin family serine protease